MHTLVKQLQALQHVTVTTDAEDDREIYYISVNLGDGFAGNYEAGYWGDCAVTNDELTLETAIDCSNEYGDNEISIWEGTVHLDYVKGSGLAYTGALNDAINERIHTRTNKLLEAGGSEQGMQGEDYLSLDVYCKDKHRKLVA